MDHPLSQQVPWLSGKLRAPRHRVGSRFSAMPQLFFQFYDQRTAGKAAVM